MNGNPRERGSALVTVLMLTTLLSAIIVAHFTLTRVELSTTRSTIDASRGFYAAEGGLNLRLQAVRQTFLGFNRPSGTSPLDGPGQNPCTPGNVGLGDFACIDNVLGDRTVSTYLTEHPGNPSLVTIPPGERHQNLTAQQYAYDVQSVAMGKDSVHEAELNMQFSSRLVPLFQFAAFYNKDLEIHPGPAMTLAGPVHTNGDLYMGSSGGLAIGGQVTTAGDLYHGTKNNMLCYAGGVTVPAPVVPLAFPACDPAGTVILGPGYLSANWGTMIQTGVEKLTVPTPEDFEPIPGRFNWDNSDARIALTVTLGGVTDIELRNGDGTPDLARSATLKACGPAADRAVDTSASFFNLREGKPIRMLDVNVVELLDCFQNNPALIDGKALSDTTSGGLAVFLTVDGPASAGINGYGVRVRDAETLASTVGGADALKGLTLISDQAAYIWGDFNAVAKLPAAVMADSINVLSNVWVDGDHASALGTLPRQADETIINAAFLAGTDITGGNEGPAGQLGAYNGGLENYPRLHETWSGIRLVYRGSFVSLNDPLHVNGPHTTPGLYNPPIRDWGYDTDFNDAANLPPMTPRFVYLKQELFVRQYGR